MTDDLPDYPQPNGNGSYPHDRWADVLERVDQQLARPHTPPRRLHKAPSRENEPAKPAHAQARAAPELTPAVANLVAKLAGELAGDTQKRSPAGSSAAGRADFFGPRTAEAICEAVSRPTMRF